jgi:hypothetical protein
MKSMKFNAIALSIILSIAITPSANAKTSSESVKAPCRLEVDYAHISKGKLKYEGATYVKVKARSICSVLQRQVTIKLKIMKRGDFFDHEVRTFQTNPAHSTSSGFRVEMNNALVRCKNEKLTYYYGVATSQALVGGQWVFAGETYSIKPKPLNCGT